MAGLANSIGGYRNKLKTTYHSVLLVEGPGDKQVFEHLKLRAIENGFNLSTKLRIDAAQTLISSSGNYPGIRQRIEQVCRDLSLGLAARDHNCLGIVRDSVRLETIEVSDKVVVDTSKLRAAVASRLGLKTDALMQGFQQWLQKVVAADRQVVRWMCDGHIGYIILWHTLVQCVQLISDGNTSDVALVRGTQKDARLSACAEGWARSLSRTSEHPQRLLDMLADDELTIVPSTEA